MNRRAWCILAVVGGLVFPTCALAHGQQILLAPVGQVAGAVVTIVALALLRVSFRIQVRLWITLFLSAPFVFIFGADRLFFPVSDRFGYGDAPMIILGFILSLVTGLIGFAIFRGIERKATRAEREADPTS